MRALLLLIGLLFSIVTLHAQVKLHAHNDYEKPTPLFNALDNKIYSIEADVFFVKGQLLVAHTLKESNRKKTLSSLYIDPLVSAFKKHHGYVSADTSYAPSLMIDIKQNGSETIQEIIRLIEPVKKYFDRSINPHAIQIIISGDRGPFDLWKNYPSYIYFDGRPFETYTQDELNKVAMVSDNYFKYLSPRNNIGDSVKITDVVKIAHNWNKPFRFWASPDTEAIWRLLYRLGTDIINTDEPARCRKYFEQLLNQTK